MNVIRWSWCHWSFCYIHIFLISFLSVFSCGRPVIGRNVANKSKGSSHSGYGYSLYRSLAIFCIMYLSHWGFLDVHTTISLFLFKYVNIIKESTCLCVCCWVWQVTGWLEYHPTPSPSEYIPFQDRDLVSPPRQHGAHESPVRGWPQCHPYHPSPHAWKSKEAQTIILALGKDKKNKRHMGNWFSSLKGPLSH